MSDAIIVALITGILTLVGTVVTVIATNRKTQRAYETSQAVIETKVEALTSEVRKHNNFAERIPVLETRVDDMGRRITELEKLERNNG